MRMFVFTFVVSLAALGTAHSAPLSYTGTPYTQNFDGLPMSNGFSNPSATIPGRGPHDINGQLGTTGMNGWTMSNPADILPTPGSADATEFRAQNGSQSGSAGRGVVSFGTDDSAERAIGTLATSNQINRFGVSMINDSGAPISSIDVAFTGEHWRRGNVPSPGNALTFAYAVTGNLSNTIDTAAIFTTVPALSFTSPNTQAAPTEVSLDGNLAGNQVALSQTIGGLNWGSGQMLMLRWTGQDISGQDDGLAIDSLRVSSAAIPEPATAIVIAIGAVMSGLLIRRRTR